MRNIVILISLLFANNVYAESLYYRFVGGALDPEIDFTLGVDFSLNGYAIGSTGNIIDIDPSRNPFFVSYISGNYSLAPSISQYQAFYGATDGPTPEGDVIGCMHVLNSISLCHFILPSDWTAGNVSPTLSLSSSMGSYETVVTLVSVSPVPLPASFFLFMSGIVTLIMIPKKYYKEINGDRKKRVALS